MIRNEEELIVHLDSGDVMKIQPLAAGLIRIRMKAVDDFPLSVMERYGVVKKEWDSCPFSVTKQEQWLLIHTQGASLKVHREDGAFELYSQSEELLVKRAVPIQTKAERGVGAAFTLKNGERFYGSGYRKEDFIQLRGHLVRNHVTYGACYGPTPFIMSTGGWGLFFNTTRDSYFDVGANDPDTMNIWSEEGELDFYLMTGDFPQMLDSYTNITGKPYLMPLWGYGLMFIMNETENQFNVLSDARTFRQEEIPCDMIGLEPGWMASHYDSTTTKDWNKERFYMPWWSEDRKSFQNVTFIGALRRSGFKLSLWLCCDYDVFEEEERLAREKEKDTEDIKSQYLRQLGFDKLDFDPRAHSPIYMDKLTKRGEPWFEHLKKFIDSGVKAFKQDPAFVVNDHPDRLYANGMTDAEAHNLYTTVLAKQVHLGYKEYTGERPMHFMGTAYAGVQKWAPTWACDCGGREAAVMSALHYSLCGHMNITSDMDVYSLEGIHFGFLQPWSQVNSWASICHPWWLGEELSQAFIDYARLHYSLIPYIYSYAHKGAETGMPILRAMPLMVPEDEEAADLNRQYMLGDWILVGAFTREIYLPEGQWIDLWTGEVYQGLQHIQYVPPENRGGALFIKAGAIIPNWPSAQYVGKQGVDEIILHFYPMGDSHFTLYEDDGISFEYEHGANAVTEISCQEQGEQVHIQIEGRKGSYKGMPENRKYQLIIHDRAPRAVDVNDTTVDDWKYTEQGEIVLKVSEALDGVPIHVSYVKG